MNTQRRDVQASRKPMLVIEGISKLYPGTDKLAVDNINLEVYEGELFALLGPSGCGKSTLLRMMAGFETPTEGKIIINGQDMTDMPPYERPVNMMFQSYALFPHMNVEQNVAFGLKQEGIPKEEIAKKVAEALDMVKMTPYAKAKPNRLSGGQQQRVALARSLIKRPKVLLLDEPLGALDKKTREHTQMELINIQNMLGITFVMVTHDQDEALSMANRIAVMESGRLLQIGSPEEIYEYPNSLFVADFIGSINTFQGIVTGCDNETGYATVKIKETMQDIRIQTNLRPDTGAEVWVALRPEELEISNNPAPAEENQVAGQIIDIGFLGDKIVYSMQLADGMIVRASLPTSARSKSFQLTTGKQAYISWHDTDGVILLD